MNGRRGYENGRKESWGKYELKKKIENGRRKITTIAFFYLTTTRAVQWYKKGGKKAVKKEVNDVQIRR